MAGREFFFHKYLDAAARAEIVETERANMHELGYALAAEGWMRHPLSTLDTAAEALGGDDCA